MPVQAGGIQIIISCNLVARFAGGQPSVNFSPFEMLAGTAFSSHVTHPTLRHRFETTATCNSSRCNPLFPRYLEILTGREIVPALL